MTELQREYDEIGRLTLAAARSAAEKYARPERAALVLVGDRAKIEAQGPRSQGRRDRRRRRRKAARCPAGGVAELVGPVTFYSGVVTRRLRSRPLTAPESSADYPEWLQILLPHPDSRGRRQVQLLAA